MCQNILKNSKMKFKFYNSSDICRSSKTHRRTHYTASMVMYVINQTGLGMYFLYRLYLFWWEDRHHDCKTFIFHHTTNLHFYEKLGRVVRYRNDDNSEEFSGSSFIWNVGTTILHTPEERNFILIAVSNFSLWNKTPIEWNRKGPTCLCFRV